MYCPNKWFGGKWTFVGFETGWPKCPRQLCSTFGVYYTQKTQKQLCMLYMRNNIVYVTLVFFMDGIFFSMNHYKPTKSRKTLE